MLSLSKFIPFCSQTITVQSQWFEIFSVNKRKVYCVKRNSYYQKILDMRFWSDYCSASLKIPSVPVLSTGSYSHDINQGQTYLKKRKKRENK